MWRSKRLDSLPPYLFVEIDRNKRAAIQAGRDVIDFGVGDPDQPTPGFIVERMSTAIRNPRNHQYALGAGSPRFRQTITDYFAKRFDVALDPDGEVLGLLGSKEGIAHLPTGVIDPGDVVLIPEPGYPVYVGGTVFAGGECHTMALSEENGWLPVLQDVPSDICRRARLMYLNYPNNPTSACATISFFENAVAFAQKHDILIAQDAAYCDLYFDPSVRPASILQVDGAKDVAIELHSLSKTFNMTGWRVAFAVGNRDALASLAKVKNNADSGIFGAIQEAAIEALCHLDHPEIRAQLESYRRRRDILVGSLKEAGWTVTAPLATFYVWAKCPNGIDSMTVAKRILDRTDVVVVPGVGFGPCGEGYVRFALTVDEQRTKQAEKRLAKLRW